MMNLPAANCLLLKPKTEQLTNAVLAYT